VEERRGVGKEGWRKGKEEKEQRLLCGRGWRKVTMTDYSGYL
jgi:hypothetical protein